MVPLLALGIPGSGSAAVMYGALTVHGILAGPRLFTERADIGYTFMVGLMSTVVAMLLFGLLTIRWSSLMVHVPNRFMVSGVLALSAIGTYGLRNSLFDVYVLIALGIVGYLLSKLDVPLVTIALGLVLGNLTEQSFQQAVMVGRVDAGSAWLYFLTRPVAVVLMVAALAVLVSGIIQSLRASRPSDAGSEPAKPAAAPRGISLRAANVVLAAVLVALAAFGLIEAREFSDRGAQLPRLLFGVILVLASLLVVSAAHPRTGAAQARSYPFADVPWRLWGGVVSATVVFGLAADRFGFYESAFVFLLLATCMMSASEASRRTRWLTPLFYAAAFDVGLYVVFRLILGIPTPPGVLL
jgi:hypothetical protein